jgi:hypothetical protein
MHYIPAMPDDLYDRDALAWSERQADLLRRLARGERVNDIDWDHVVEEIEDVGLSELHAVESYLEQLLAHLLKLRGWPEFEARDHWRGEIVTFRRGRPTLRTFHAPEDRFGRTLPHSRAANGAAKLRRTEGSGTARRLPGRTRSTS